MTQPRDVASRPAGDAQTRIPATGTTAGTEVEGTAATARPLASHGL